MGDGLRPIQTADACSDKPNARRSRCVLLAQHGRPPESLLDSFHARGVEVSIEAEPVLALAALGAAIVEHRQQAARQSTFHATGQSSALHPTLILVVVEPAQWDDFDDLAACVERTMPQVTVAVYSTQSGAGLEVLRRGQTAERSAAAPARETESNGRARGARPPLRLADAPAPLVPRAERAAGSPFDEEDALDSQPEHEALITQAELAMLLGEDPGPEPARGEHRS